ncbi:serine protease [Lentzea sp. NPDC004782]|uniref:serine protease n=1 Tax=Lentzea sp. NPDC004782 TaxID=3154458 RepID=UPI0033BADDAD
MSPARRALKVSATVALLATGLLTGCGPDLAGTTADGEGTPTSALPTEQLTVSADQAGRQWPAASAATIKPGVQTYTTGSGQCTANYVFVDETGNVYLGQAAHCASTGESNETNGCSAGSLPLETAVTFNRGGSPAASGTVVGTGQLAYSSWLTMHKRGEKDQNVCAYNDFALVKVTAKDYGKVNPSLPYWGGPNGINTTGANPGDRVYSYGNSSLRLGITELSPQTGQITQSQSTGGWTHALAAPTPGVPGDSGSAFLDRGGNALGTLSTLGLSLPIINNIGDIGRELAYAQAHSGIPGLRLVLGTEPFTPNR